LPRAKAGVRIARIANKIAGDRGGNAKSNLVTDAQTILPSQKRWAGALALLRGERRRAGISFTVGLIVLMLIQIPAVEQSFVGAPDREMIQSAFELRSDLVGGTAAPALFLDIDDRTLSKLSPAPFAPPLETAPRGAIADILDFIRTAPPAQAPRVVVLDVDIAQPSSDGPTGVSRLQSALASWAKSSSTPSLIIARQAFPASLFGQTSDVPILPDSPYDSVVQSAPNIFWSTPKVVGDQGGVVREFTPFECVQTRAGIQPLYSAALLAYQFVERNPNVLARAPARHWIDDAVAHCRAEPGGSLGHGERIDFHISLDLGFNGRVWPNLSPLWPGFKTCDASDRAIFRRLSVIDIVDALRAGGDVSHDLLCQRVVLIGGTNASAGDFVQTPLNEMNGTVVLANAIRGLELTHGGLRPIPLPFQVVLLMLVVLAFSFSAMATEQAKHRHRALRNSPHRNKFGHQLAIISLNPLVLNGMIAVFAHVVGIGLLLVSLNFGLWGFLSAPAFAVAITETIQEFLNG
jgi:CHASE2 domain-containing sensor protein